MTVNSMKYLFAVLFLIISILGVRAEGVEEWIKGSEQDPAAAAAATPVDPAPAVKIVSKVRMGGGHTLDEIIYKVSRAKNNLENYGSDLDGHGPKAIEHLTQALEELKKAK